MFLDKPVIFQGSITATYKDYSDRMLELLLKAHRPDKFKDRVESKIDHTSSDKSMTPVALNMTAQEAAEAYAASLEEGGEG